MKKVKRIIAIVISLAMLLPCLLTVTAVQKELPVSQNERLLLIEILSEIEQQKDSWGLTGIDFAELRVGHLYIHIIILTEE